MANEIILVDTSILIDYYRKTDKANSRWIALVRQVYNFAVSVATKYEIYSGAKAGQLSFWKKALQTIEIIPLDDVSVDIAVNINSSLKRKQIDLADLFIAATAIANNYSLATLNGKHFDRIDGLSLID